MESDGITRLYLSPGSLTTARLVYPFNEVTSHAEKLTGAEAREVLKRQDFHCGTSIHREKKTNGKGGKITELRWTCYSEPGEEFVISLPDCKREEVYTKVVEEIERRAGKTGLTIVAT